MDTTDESSNEDKHKEDRATLKESLDEIAAEVGSAMRDAGLHYSVGLTIPFTGDALVSMLTLDHPSSADWQSATAIVYETIAKRLGGIKLRSRELPCAMINVAMNVVDVIAD